MELYPEKIALGTRPAPVMVGAQALQSERRILLEDRVQLPRVYFAWHTPAMFEPDDAELDLVGDLVANGKTSRLYRSLVYEDRIALDVSAAQQSRAMSSVFVLTATAAPGRSLSDVAARIDVALTRLASDGPTEAEMERSRAQIESHFLYRLQTVGGFGGKSDQLNAYNVLRGDPGYFEADLSRYQAATRESVRTPTARHLLSSGRVALSVVPTGQATMALPGSEPIVVS
jgi:zinc protease